MKPRHLFVALAPRRLDGRARGPAARRRAPGRPVAVSRAALPRHRTVPREPHGRRRGRAHRAQRLLHGRQRRRRLEDRRLRPHVDADLRRGADGIGRRHRGVALEPERHLRRERRGPAPARPRRGRRHLQVHRRRPHLAARRPRRRPAGRPHRRAPDRPRHRVRGGHGPSVRAERGARRLPHDRRRAHVAEGPVRGSQHRRQPGGD